MNMHKENMKNWRDRRKAWWILIPFIAAFAIAVLSALVMYLWNAVMPKVFPSVNTISYVQALGIFLLAKILFGGWKGKGGRGFGRRRGGCGNGCNCGPGCNCGCNNTDAAKVCKDKWMGMTDEERNKFKEEWKNRGGSCNC